MQLLSIEIRTNTEFKRTALLIAPYSALSLAGCSESNLLPMAMPDIDEPRPKPVPRRFKVPIPFRFVVLSWNG